MNQLQAEQQSADHVTSLSAESRQNEMQHGVHHAEDLTLTGLEVDHSTMPLLPHGVRSSRRHPAEIQSVESEQEDEPCSSQRFLTITI